MNAPEKRLALENGNYIDVYEKWITIDGIVYCVWFRPTPYKEPPVIQINFDDSDGPRRL